MALIDIIILILAISVVLGVIYYRIKKRNKTTNYCSGNCSKCNMKH